MVNKDLSIPRAGSDRPRIRDLVMISRLTEA